MKFSQLGIATAALLALTACEQKPEPAAHTEETYQPLTQRDAPPPATTDPYATDPYATDPMVPPQDTAATDELVAASSEDEETLIAGEDATSPRTHVVQKGDTFYKLARMYYNDQSKWKDIWEANRTRIPDPNKIEVGTKLIIP